MQIATEGQRDIKGHGEEEGMCVRAKESRPCFVEVFQVTAPCFYGYSVSNDSPDVLPFV